MEDGRIPKDVLYGELVCGSRAVGRPVLRFKDVCRRDLKTGGIDDMHWEAQARDRDKWRACIKSCVKKAETRRRQQQDEKRLRRKQRQQQQESSNFVCEKCGKDCHARIGLSSHKRHCDN